MNRLQKKCLIATAGGHLLLILILVFGSAFFVVHSKVDESQVLDVIPANIVEAAFNSGVRNAQPPAPTPVQPPQPVPLPPQPKPVVTPPPEPQPQPKPEPVKQPDPEPVKPPKPEPDDIKSPEPKPVKPVKPKTEIKVDLTPTTQKSPTAAETKAAAARAEAQQQAKARADAIKRALTSINDKASSATEVDMPGTSSVSYANYASVLRTIYEREWRTPNNASNDDANTRVSVTIRNDGTVVSSRILTPSGDPKVDASVQTTLDHVTFIAPFPDGAKEKEKTFIITFNLKLKRMLG